MKHFRNHGFAHFDIISDMMPSRSKGAYVFRVGGKRRDPPPSTSTQPPNTLVMDETHQSLSSSGVSSNLNHLPMPVSSETLSHVPHASANNPLPIPDLSHIPHAGAFQLPITNASAPPSAPSSFLSPSESQHNSGALSVLTSISRGTRKASVILGGESVAGTTVSETARKCNRNQPSATVTVQNKHADALEHAACSVNGLSKTMANHTLTTNNDVCKQAATSLKAHISDYLVKDYLALGMYLMAEKTNM